MTGYNWFSPQGSGMPSASRTNTMSGTCWRPCVGPQWSFRLMHCLLQHIAVRHPTPNQKGTSAFAMIMNHEFLMTILPISFSLQGPVDIFGLSFDTGSGAAYTHSHTAYIVVVSKGHRRWAANFPSLSNPSTDSKTRYPWVRSCIFSWAFTGPYPYRDRNYTRGACQGLETNAFLLV